MTKGPVRVVVLGGGFGGVYTARRLERHAARGPALEITLVNRDNFLLFTPMLHEVAASDLDLVHIVNPLRKLLRRTAVIVGEIEAIDLDRRTVRVAHGSGGHPHELDYDHLVLALGSVTNDFGLPGLVENTLTMKSLADAIGVRNRLVELLEEADYDCATDDRERLLTVLVVGGGFAGVETVAAAHDFLHDAIGHYPRLAPEMLRVVLVEATHAILPELGPELGRYAERVLGQRGVEIRLGTAVSAVDAGGVRLTDGTTIPTGCVVWTAGVAPNPLVAGLPCALERGRVRVESTLRVADRPGLWALGDCAAVPDRRGGGFHPPTAQHAIRQATVLADNLVAELRGRALRAFEFTTLGQLAAIGRRTGVARILGLRFSGFLAWWLWRTVYLAKLPRLERKVRVVLDWTLDLVFSKDLVQLKVRQAPTRFVPASPVAPAGRSEHSPTPLPDHSTPPEAG